VKYILIFIALFLLGGIFLIISKNQEQSSLPQNNFQIPTPQEEIASLPYTASFSITTQGTKRIFTDTKYHQQSTEVFISSNDPSKVTVTKNNITWQNFFDTLPSPMKLTPDCLTTGTGQVFCSNNTSQLYFTINGVSDPNALEKIIQPNDILDITYSDIQ
jgi:hypothetical protein